MKKILIAVVTLCVVIASYLFYLFYLKPFKASVTSVSQTIQALPVQETVGNPITFSIPKLNLVARVESVGMDDKGRMDVPKNPSDVAWYNLGFRPGQKGSAVIDGHVDTPTGQPAVFAQIATLQQGDSITVQDSFHKTYSFIVTKVINYPYDSLPLEIIFNSTDKSRLNLITCAGIWDKVAKNYSERTVVFAERK